MGEKIVEVPISYQPRTVERGKKSRSSDGRTAIWTLIRYRFDAPQPLAGLGRAEEGLALCSELCPGRRYSELRLVSWRLWFYFANRLLPPTARRGLASRQAASDTVLSPKPESSVLHFGVQSRTRVWSSMSAADSGAYRNRWRFAFIWGVAGVVGGRCKASA